MTISQQDNYLIIKEPIKGTLISPKSSSQARSSLLERECKSGQTLSFSDVKLEIEKAIAKIQPNEQQKVAEKFYYRLKKLGLSECSLGLSTDNPEQMSIKDISHLAAFAYQIHPDIFQEVLVQESSVVHFLSNCIVSEILNILAGKWLNGYTTPMSRSST
ncbi:MAG: hypothetical protein ACOC04_04240 [Halothece sp.]